MAFENYVLPDNDAEPKLDLHFFKAVFSEYITGEKTGAQCINVLEASLGEHQVLPFEFTSSDMDDLVFIRGLVDAETGIVNKRIKVDEIYRVFVLANKGAWYTTRALLKTRIGFTS